MMNNLAVMISEQRKSSVHLDIEKPENIQNNDNVMNNPSEIRNARSGVNCSFTAYYGRKSPKAKRRREDDKDETRRMKTFDVDPKDDPSYETETLVLSEITENIKDKQINELIHRFSPVIRNFPDQIKKEMLEFSSEWVNKKQIFIDAISCVTSVRKDDHNNEKELKEICLERLSEILIREVENRMPKYCRKCKVHYIVKPIDCPELHCMWCKVGMHDCTKMNQMKDRPGIKWLCETCEPIFNTHYLTKLDPVAIFEGFELRKPPSTTNKVVESEKEEVEMLVNQESEQVALPSKVPTRGDREQEDMEKIEVVAEIHRGKNGDTRISKKQKDTIKTKDDKDANNHHLPTSITPTGNERKICWFYENRKCKFGEQCRNHHPEACQQLLEYGKCTKDRCNLVHPNVCRLFFQQGGCRRMNCWYIHPSKLENRNEDRTSENGTQRNRNENNSNNK